MASSWYAQARKLQKLQNQNVLLNHLAKKYEIIPEGANLARQFFGNSGQAAGHVILTRQKVKSLKKYNKSKFTLKKKDYQSA